MMIIILLLLNFCIIKDSQKKSYFCYDLINFDFDFFLKKKNFVVVLFFHSGHFHFVNFVKLGWIQILSSINGSFPFWKNFKFWSFRKLVQWKITRGVSVWVLDKFSTTIFSWKLVFFGTYLINFTNLHLLLNFIKEWFLSNLWTLYFF